MPSRYGKERQESEWAIAIDRTIKILIYLSCRFVASLRGHVAAVYRLAWSADSRILISASKDTTLKVSWSSFRLPGLHLLRRSKALGS